MECKLAVTITIGDDVFELSEDQAIALRDYLLDKFPPKSLPLPIEIGEIASHPPIIQPSPVWIAPYVIPSDPNWLRPSIICGGESK